MGRSLTMAHLGALLVLLAFFLPVVGAPMLTAIQREAGTLPAGFSVWDLARLQGVGGMSWHALLVLAVGGIGALMAFTGPHRGLWVPAGAWLLGLAVELRLLSSQLRATPTVEAHPLLSGGIEPWGWAAGVLGAVLWIVASVSNARAANQ
jgi:hypothetical protein